VCFFTVRIEEKMAALLYLLKNIIDPNQLTLIFAATKHHVEFIYEILQLSGLESGTVYGSMDPTARKIQLAKFRTGKLKMLIVTDVAARGIDIPLLDNVINFDFPAKPKIFVHRVGRAARNGRSGTAYSLVSTDEVTRKKISHFLDMNSHCFVSLSLSLSQ
jgi:ATP-dependent RNA helicase DDX54/DBP10